MDTKEFIFNLYKDQVVFKKKLKKEMIKKYRMSERDISDVYARITNYQIKTYGNGLSIDTEIHTKEELDRIHFNSRARKHMKKK